MSGHFLDFTRIYPECLPFYGWLHTVVLISSQDEDDFLDSYQNGANGFLQKPMNKQGRQAKTGLAVAKPVSGELA